MRNDDSEIIEKTDSETVTKILVLALDSLSGRSKRCFWDAKHELCLIRAFLTTFSHFPFLSNSIKDPSLHGMTKTILLTECSEMLH